MSDTMPEPVAHLRALLHPLASVGESRRTSTRRVGGKAASLGRLLREGFPVPPGWVLDGRVFERVVERTLPRGHDIASLVKLATTRSGVDRAARARDRLLAEPLPDDLAQAVDALWREVEPDAPWGLAVRSSATCEDADETSLAGLATSVLGVRGPEAIGRAIREVWASAFLPRALAYLARSGVRDLAMAVVLQPMVRAEAAGVLFTAPPAGLAGPAWGEGERLVHATLGLGAPVVEGATTTDTIRLAREGGAVVDAVIADKRRALVVGENGLENVDVPEDVARAPALAPEALRELADLAERLDALGGDGFDVEFAVERDGDARRVRLLQARPLGGRGYPEGGDAETVWSRANVGEALPGAATPLTWSIARGFSDKGFREAFAALGCRVPRGVTLVANVQGRFYLNLTAFMRISAQVPGLGPRRVLGVSGGANDAAIAVLERQVEDVSKKGFFVRLPLSAPRLLAQQARVARDVEAYEAKAARAERGLLDIDLGLLPDDSLATTLKSARALLDETGTLMLRAASSSLASHLALVEALSLFCRKRASARGANRGDESVAGPRLDASGIEQLAQTLTGGVRELDSASPGIALARVAGIARREPEAQAKVLRGEVHAPKDLLPGPTRRALEQFLATYGYRAVREAELSTPRWREDPSSVIAMLTADLRAQESDPERALARARATADRELARLETRLPALEIRIVRALVERAQHFTRLRERMRTWVTRVLGMLRIIALDVDRRLRRIDPQLEEGGVFYCTFDELTAALASGRADIGHVVRLRRAEYARDAARPDPPPTFIGRPPPVTLPPVAGTRLEGLPASSGVVEGRARVLKPGAVGLDDVQPGEVLVSRTTDVGLSPLFLVAAAVVTELGGPLSHAAVVAREYGVPAVVNVPGATAAIHDGDRLRVDGDRGIVERIEEAAPHGR